MPVFVRVPVFDKVRAAVTLFDAVCVFVPVFVAVFDIVIVLVGLRASGVQSETSVGMA